jgi:hypothetical protein
MLPIMSVWPSGLPRAISSIARMPEAPGLLSTNTAPPSTLRTCSANSRATTSVNPPGA